MIAIAVYEVRPNVEYATLLFVPIFRPSSEYIVLDLKFLKAQQTYHSMLLILSLLCFSIY